MTGIFSDLRRRRAAYVERRLAWARTLSWSAYRRHVVRIFVLAFMVGVTLVQALGLWWMAPRPDFRRLWLPAILNALIGFGLGLVAAQSGWRRLHHADREARPGGAGPRPT